MPRYLVSKDDRPEDEPAVIQAADARHAAEAYVERHHDDLGQPADIDVRVREPGSVVSRWAVAVTLVPRAWAKALEGGPRR